MTTSPPSSRRSTPCPRRPGSCSSGTPRALRSPAAVDARPDRVGRAVYVGGFPTGDGDAIADGYPATDGEVPLPDWSAFEEEELADLDEVALAAFRERAVPSPGGSTRDPQRLSDDRRYDVPVTVIATEFTGEMLRGWIAGGLAPVRELQKIRDVELVDLPTGHWPQFTRPTDLGRVILASLTPGPDPRASAAERRRGTEWIRGRGRIAEAPRHGRDEPSGSAGSRRRDRHPFGRARAQPCGPWHGNAADSTHGALQATLGPSSITLGGLLEHLAFVEDDAFSGRLLTSGRAGALRRDTVDFKADPDWDWRSAAEDSPEHLFALWQDSVRPVPLPGREGAR